MEMRTQLGMWLLSVTVMLGLSGCGGDKGNEFRAFDKEKDKAPDAEHGHAHSHDHGHDHGSNLKVYHDEEMQSVSIRIDGDLDPNKFMPWINDLVQREGPNILRSKGILAFKDDPKRFVFQGVHMILDGDSQREWRVDEKRQSKVVFIGRKLDKEKLREGVLSCAA